MKKLRKFYKNNRIYCILMLISLFCFILMGSAVVIYFVNQATSSNYGNRLDEVEKYPVDKELKKIEKFYKDAKGVKSSTVRLQGRIIYITVEVEKETTNEVIQNMANSSIEVLTEEQGSYYDVQFIFKRADYTPYMGSKSSANKVITWNNYSFDNEEEKTDK